MNAQLTVDSVSVKCPVFTAVIDNLYFVYVVKRKQSADWARRSVYEGEGELEKAQSSASIPSSVWRRGLAASAAQGEEAGCDRRSPSGVNKNTKKVKLVRS